MDSSRHVRGCHSTDGIRARDAFNEEASTIHQSLPATTVRGEAESRLPRWRTSPDCAIPDVSSALARRRSPAT